MADMILPVAMQQGDTEQAYRAPEVYLMRLPDSRSAKKKAPYIIHRVIPLDDVLEVCNGPTGGFLFRYA